jgi:PAS domain-containing protein
MAPDEQLIDMIHEAALDTALWVPVMEQVADAVGGQGATLARLNMLDGSGEAILARSDPATLDSYAAHFQSRNVLTIVEDPASYRAGVSPGVATDENALPRDAFLRSEFYNDFLRPQDIDSALWIRLELADREVCTITIGRSARRGRFAAADLEAARLLQPHLVRAYKMGRNLAASRDLALAIDHARHAVLLLDRDGRLRHANALAAALLAAGKALTVSAGRLLAGNASTNSQLQALIAAGLYGKPRSGGAMALSSARAADCS